MRVKYHRNFIRNYKKRFSSDKKVQSKYAERVKLFIKNTENPVLGDHKLKDKMLNLRSFSITGDIRVIYIIIEDIACFLDIGTHNQVY